MTIIFPIQKLRNVSVTNNAVIISKGKIVRDSCVGEDFYKKYQKLKFRLKYFFPIFTCPNKSYILATDEWSKNYCHWLWEALSKLILLKKEFPNSILILQKSYGKIDFMMKSLEAFGFSKSNIKFIPKKSHLRVKNLAFIQAIGIPSRGYYDFLNFSEVAQTLVSYYQKELKTDFGEKIYISRNRPDKNVPRKVNNEKELVAMLERYGFKTIYMEKFSFLEQVSISSHARFIIAPHGAGISNVMFAKKKCSLLELVNRTWQKTCFAEMCEKIDVNYHRFDCAEFGSESLHLSDINVDVEELEEKLTKILR
jgi:capsular polysaccharide biosynthesis protein